MMFAMDGLPFAGNHSGRETQTKAEKVTYRRMQRQGAMCLVPMQKNRNRGDGEMSQRKRDPEVAPERQVDKTIEEHSESLPFDRRPSRLGWHCTGGVHELLAVFPLLRGGPAVL
jgi:hypothetical protein